MSQDPTPSQDARLQQLEARLKTVEDQNQEQTGKLDLTVGMLKEMRTAIVGDAPLGITGIVVTAKSAHRRLDEVEKDRASFEAQAVKRMETIEASAEREKWMGRIGSGVVGAAIAGAGLWLKGLFFAGK